MAFINRTLKIRQGDGRATKMYRGSNCIVARVFNPSSRWIYVSLISWLLYPQRKAPPLSTRQEVTMGTVEKRRILGIVMVTATYSSGAPMYKHVSISRRQHTTRNSGSCQYNSDHSCHKGSVQSLWLPIWTPSMVTPYAWGYAQTFTLPACFHLLTHKQLST